MNEASRSLDDYITMAEAVAITGYTQVWIRRLFRQGRIRGYVIGRHATIYLRADVEKWAGTVRRGNPTWVTGAAVASEAAGD